MKNLIYLILILLLGCRPTIEEKTEYFTNPIMQGFYPDPSICKVMDKFYMVQSSFSYFPGIPIFESSDLVNWKQIGHVMDRASQLNTIGAGISRGLFAPTIRYHNGMFYVICTEVDRGGNFIVTATDPKGPWSNPIYFPQIDGIDPSLFFEGEKTYITYNSIPPDNKSLWSGHRTIRMWELDREKMKLTGDQTILIDGGTDKSIKPVWIEAPHIYKVDEYYYLMCAQGGTSINHTEVVFRSKEIKGPYIPYEGNPVLTQKHLDPSRPNPITTTGHSDMIQLDNGDWWAVFLGCRPYETVSKTEPGYFNIGRETFLAPVQWTDGWPVINPDFEEVQFSYPVPVKGTTINENSWPTGNFQITEDFDKSKLDLYWTFLRTPQEKWWNLSEKPGFLTLETRSETCSELDNPSFIGRRLQHIKFECSASLGYDPKDENEKAGLVVFQNETHYYFLAKSIEANSPVVQLYQSTDTVGIQNHEAIKLLSSSPIDSGDLELKIASQGATLSFHWRQSDSSDWTLLEDNVDAKFLSTKVAGGFVGSFVGMHTTSMGQDSDSKALFDWFVYKGDDEVYKSLP